MAKHQTTAHDTGATSLSRDRELRDDELDRVTGGLVVVTPQNVTLLGPPLLIPSAPAPAKHWFNGG
jgi:hypothetical protein